MNPCTVTVEPVRDENSSALTNRVRVMLHIGNGGQRKGMPVGEFDGAATAGAVATFVLGAVSAAYIAGIEDAHARALESLAKLERAK